MIRSFDGKREIGIVRGDKEKNQIETKKNLEKIFGLFAQIEQNIVEVLLSKEKRSFIREASQPQEVEEFSQMIQLFSSHMNSLKEVFAKIFAGLSLRSTFADLLDDEELVDYYRDESQKKIKKIKRITENNKEKDYPFLLKKLSFDENRLNIALDIHAFFSLSDRFLFYLRQMYYFLRGSKIISRSDYNTKIREIYSPIDDMRQILEDLKEGLVEHYGK